MKKNILLVLLLLATLYSCKDENSHLADGLYAKIETTKGSIFLMLEYNKAPVTVANFITLAEGTNTFVTSDYLKGRHFYDGLKFHRVMSQFMIQGGDPEGTGSGDAGYKFKDEFSDLRFDKGGILAMANNGPATNSSQFFITHVPTPWLDNAHTIFGHVVDKGMEVVNKIQQDDVIKSITIIRKGEAAKKFNAVKVFEDYFKSNQTKYKKVTQEKVAYFETLKAKTTKTADGLKYVITQKGNGKKPAKGTTVAIHYAGFLENGKLFDTSIESVAQTFGTFDANRAAQGGYQPIPFQTGKKDGMIPGFIEGIEKMSFGDKAVLFIPSHLAYGAGGAGDVIPPNSNIIFEVELLQAQ